MDTKTVVKGCLKTGISLFLLVGLPVGTTLVTNLEPAMARHRRRVRPQPPRPNPNQSDSSGNRPGNGRVPGFAASTIGGVRPQPTFTTQSLRSNSVQLQQAFGG
jgi:hypothetical protein